MIEVEIINEQNIHPITDSDIELIEKVLKEAAKLEQLTAGEVVVTLVDDQRIQELNQHYRGLDQPTDVLSFAMNEQGEDDLDIIFAEDDQAVVPNMLGDIVISIPRAVEQAEEYGHSFARELGFLTVHGFLHLLGYDHYSPEEESLMLGKQEETLIQLNILR